MRRLLTQPAWLSSSQKETILDEQTRLYYESLTLDERAELVQCLEQQFDAIPIPTAVKQRGLNDLTLGVCETRSSLLLLRYAMRTLNYSLE